MSNKEILEIFTRKSAIIRDHVVYSSGLHGDTYVDKDALYPYPVIMCRIGAMICEALATQAESLEIPLDIDAVLVPQGGAIALGQWVGFSLPQVMHGGEHPRVIHAEEAPQGDLVLSRHYAALVEGRRVLVLDDILTTGSTVRKLVTLVHALGGMVAGVAVICDHGRVTPQDLDPGTGTDGAPSESLFVSLATVPCGCWKAPCPLCLAGTPINADVGHGREYLASLAAVHGNDP